MTKAIAIGAWSLVIDWSLELGHWCFPSSLMSDNSGPCSVVRFLDTPTPRLYKLSRLRLVFHRRTPLAFYAPRDARQPARAIVVHHAAVDPRLPVRPTRPRGQPP